MPISQRDMKRLSPQLRDAGKRIADFMNQSFQDLDRNYLMRGTTCMAFALIDGACDGIVYDSKTDAMRHQSGDANKYMYMFFRNCAAGVDPDEAGLFLLMNRQAYDKGYRFADPEAVGGGPSLAPTATTTDQFRHSLDTYGMPEMETLIRIGKEAGIL